MKKLLTKSLIFLLISGLITKVILYLIDVVIAREYGVSTFGIYSLADSFLSILILFADFGLNSFILAKYHDLKTSNIFDLFKVSILKTLLSFISFLLILSLGFWKFNYVPANEIYFILAFNFILTSFNNFIFFYFRAILIPAYETVVRSLGFIITFLVIFFLKPFGISLELFLLFLVLIQVLTLLINTFILFKKKEPVKSTVSLKSLFHEILPYGLSIIFVEVYYYFDSLIIGINFNANAVGLYKAAYAIITIFSFVLTLGYYALIPLYSRDQVDNETEKFIKGGLFISSILIPIFVIFFSDTIIRFVYGDAYLYSSNVLKVLILTVPFMWNYALYSIKLISKGFQKDVTKITMIGCLINVVLNLIFTTRFSIFSAAIITIITEASMFGLTYKVYKDKYREVSSSLVSV